MSFWCHRFNQNSNENIVRISALKFFVASWGLPGSFLGLPGDLVSNIINKEAYRKPKKASRKPQGSFKKFQGRNPYNILVAILVETMTPKRHFEINWPLRKVAALGPRDLVKTPLIMKQFMCISSKNHLPKYDYRVLIKRLISLESKIQDIQL